MSAMQAEVFEAFRAIDVPEDEALRAAAALPKALSGDVREAAAPVMRTDVEALKADVSVLKADMGVLKADVAVLKTDVGALRIGLAKADGGIAMSRRMMGFVLVTLLFRVFTHKERQMIDAPYPRTEASPGLRPVHVRGDGEQPDHVGALAPRGTHRVASVAG